METVGAADFFDKLFSVESSDFMLLLQDDDHGFHNNCFPFDPTINPSHDHVSQLVQSDNDESTKFFMIAQKEFETSSVFDPDEVIRDIPEREHTQLGNSDSLQQGAEEQTFRDGNPKKRTRVSRDGKKNKRNANPKPKKNHNNMTENEEEDKYESNTIMSANNAMQSSSCCSSEGDSMTTTADLKGKTRATRGSATDPQSLYARRRRERINERLKILQSLVPNGTKVDISTMLEEAVHYVKFMQLQIKLLSSDDMWMYAPIAYNGMDMGLYQKMLPSL